MDQDYGRLVLVSHCYFHLAENVLLYVWYGMNGLQRDVKSTFTLANFARKFSVYYKKRKMFLNLENIMQHRTKIYNNFLRIIHDSKNRCFILKTSKTVIVSGFKEALIEKRFFYCHWISKAFPSHFYSVLMNFLNLEYRFFACCLFSDKPFHVRQTYFRQTC